MVRRTKDIDRLPLHHVQLHQDRRTWQVRAGTGLAALHFGTDSSQARLQVGLKQDPNQISYLIVLGITFTFKLLTAGVGYIQQLFGNDDMITKINSTS
jgi:hypothetical protein